MSPVVADRSSLSDKLNSKYVH